MGRRGADRLSSSLMPSAIPQLRARVPVVPVPTTLLKSASGGAFPSYHLRRRVGARAPVWPALPVVSSDDHLALLSFLTHLSLSSNPLRRRGLGQPGIRGVWRTPIILTAFGEFATIASTVLSASLLPADAQRMWPLCRLS